MPRPFTVRCAALLLLPWLLWTRIEAAQLGEGACGPVPLPGQTILYDYLNQDDPFVAGNMKLLWEHHLSNVDPDIANGRIQDALYQLDFTLRYCPNHYWALRKIVQIQKANPGVVYDPGRGKTDVPTEFDPTPECYFDRALRFQPRDPNMHLLFGIYYQQMRKLDDALDQYRLAEAMQPGSSEVQYNMGLVYFEQKQYDEAAARARRAYELGYPLPGLKNKLKSVGRWPAAGSAAQAE